MTTDAKGEAVSEPREEVATDDLAAEQQEAAVSGEPDAADGGGAIDAPANGAVPRTPLVTPLGSAIGALHDQKQKLHDRLLRAAADLDNYKKRARRDLTDSVQRAEERIALAFLPILDNLERAIAHAGEDAGEDGGALVDGVRMVRKQFLDALERHGIEPFESVGTPFDPSLQEAIQQQPSDQPRGTVVHELQKGYRRSGRLVRPAMVVVSSGPAEQSKPANDAEVVVGADGDVVVDDDAAGADGTEDTG